MIIRLALSFIFLFPCFLLKAQQGDFYVVPDTEISVKEILSSLEKDTIIEEKSFKVSPLITLGAYKEFLTFLATEYGENKVVSYLPDSNICLALEDYIAYLTDTIYEKHPVLGISWENAMSYCIWRSRKDQLEEGFYYLLPNFSEYAAIRKEDSLNPDLNLINEDYSEWSLITKDESILDFAELLIKDKGIAFLNYYYFAETSDPPAMKRKVILGNNFHFKRRDVFLNDYYSHYQNKGYHYVSFRLVKKELNKKEEQNINTSMIRLYDYE